MGKPSTGWCGQGKYPNRASGRRSRRCSTPRFGASTSDSRSSRWRCAYGRSTTTASECRCRSRTAFAWRPPARTAPWPRPTTPCWRWRKPRESAASSSHDSRTRLIIRSGVAAAPNMCFTCDAVEHMSKMIQIRNVPDELHRRLKVRAAERGTSLSEFLLAEVEEIADRPTLAELMERLATDEPVELDEPPEVTIRRIR